jgi:hypothetical protein
MKAFSEMKTTQKTGSEDPKPVVCMGSARLLAVTDLLNKFSAELPQDAMRVEIDIEYADGGRVKLEAKA